MNSLHLVKKMGDLGYGKQKASRKWRIFKGPLSKLEEITLANKGYVSKYYSLLVAFSTESTLDKLNAWKIDIKEDIDEIDWNEACLKGTKTNYKYSV